MRRADESLTHDRLSGLRIPSQPLELLVSGVSLDYLELPLDVVLHDVLELCLYLLRLAEDLPELGGKCAMHSLLNTGLWLLRVGLL